MIDIDLVIGCHNIVSRMMYIVRTSVAKALCLGFSWIIVSTYISARQIGDATLTITTVDSNKAILPSATVSLDNGLGFRLALLTNQQGLAIFANLASGRYRLRVEAEHFEPEEREVTIKSRSQAITVRLEIARIKDEIVVSQSEREKRTDPRSDTFTTILTQEQITNLPDDPDELKAELERLAGPGAIILVDGFAGGRIPPKSQIRQIRFRRNSFAAEYHEVGLVVVEILTKPSAGNWRSSIGFGFRNQVLDARNAFAPSRAPEGLQRLEVTLDVPIQPNRTALFLAADGKQLYDSKTIVAALPAGNFNGVARLPSRNLHVSARFNQVLSKNHDLRMNFFRTGSRNGNLGVGNFNLPERAFTSNSTDRRLQIAETGVVGNHIFHEFRLQLHWQETNLRSASDAPGLIVLGAFHGGGAQIHSDKELAEAELRENVDFARKQHAMRAGLMLEVGSYSNLNLNNQRGAFTFSSLVDFRAGRPANFSQRVDIKPVGFVQRQLGAYWQDDWRVVPSLTLSYGIRYERQNNLQNNYAPRFGFGWSPFKNGRTAIRGGVGVFYDWLTAAIYSDLLNEDGRHGTNLIITNPGFPNPFSGGTQLVLPPSRSQRAAGLRNPYVMQGSLNLQRQLPGGLSLLAGYAYQRGFHLFRGRDVNAPIPGSGRPDSSAGKVALLESSARSLSQVLDLTLNSGASRRMSWMINYSLSKRINETDGAFGLPADNRNLRAERGPATDDARQRLTITTGLGVLKGWRLTPTFFYSSPMPYNITTGRDDNQDTVFNDRPIGVARNSVRGAPVWNVNLRLSWLFGFGKSNEASRAGTRTIKVKAGDYGAITSDLEAFGKKWRFNFYLQTTNLFNHINSTNFVGIMTSPFFGKSTAAAAPRHIETGIKFEF